MFLFESVCTCKGHIEEAVSGPAGKGIKRKVVHTAFLFGGFRPISVKDEVSRA